MRARKRIGEAFARARTEGRGALVVYLCAGDPDLETTARLVPALVEAGADVLELGVPFSDPIADGPVIQAASERALASGTSLRRVLALVRRLRDDGMDAPLALMTYLNPVHALGDLPAIAAAGVDGLIVPDLPYDEAAPWRQGLDAVGVDLVGLAAPTTEPARLAAIGGTARGFLYFVSVTGVTGTRHALPSELPSQLAAARAVSKVPVAVGFGVESAEQAAALAPHADGVIVGSALIKSLQGPGGEAAALALVRSLSHALRRDPSATPAPRPGEGPTSTTPTPEVPSC